MRILSLLITLILASPAAWADAEADRQAALHTDLRAVMAACAGVFNQHDPNAKSVVEAAIRSRSLSPAGPCHYAPANGSIAKPDAKPLLKAALEIVDAERLSLNCETNTSSGCTMLTRLTLLARSMTRAGDATPAPQATDFEYNANGLTLGVEGDTIYLGRLILARGAPAEAAKFDGTDVADTINNIVETPCLICRHDAREVMPYVAVMDALLIVHKLAVQGSTWGKLADIADTNTARWNAYHFGGGQARTQLPWELAINGLIYNVTNQPKEGESVDSLPEAPSNAITFLHPSIGITPFDDAGADSTIVGVVELLGYSWWKYGPDNKRHDEWGLSAVSVYQPRDNGKDWNYGLLLRTPVNGLNVVWSRVELDNGDDEDIFAFSIDPGTLFESFSGGGIECLFGLKTC